MTPTEHNKILEELDEYSSEIMRPDDVTVKELAKRWGVGLSTVQARMQRAVDEGKYITLKLYNPVSRRQVRVWRRVEPIDDQEEL